MVYTIKPSEELVHAFQQLLAEAGGSGNNHAKHLKVGEFDHHGIKVRGIKTAVDIKKGEEVLTVPPHGGLQMRPTEKDLSHPRFNKLPGGPAMQLGFWFAEQKAKLKDHHSHHQGAAQDKYLDLFIHAIPTLTEYKAMGIPVASSPADLHRLHGLPHVGQIETTAGNKQKDISSALAKHNAAAGTYPKLSSEDALWGYIVAKTRLWYCSKTGKRFLAPVGDMFNTSGTNSNVDFKCKDGDKDPNLLFRANRDISAGEELTFQYHKNTKGKKPEPSDGLSAFQNGIIGGAPPTHWSEKDCSKIRNAHLDREKSALLQNVSKLVDHHCVSLPTPAPPRTIHGSNDGAAPQAAIRSSRNEHLDKASAASARSSKSSITSEKKLKNSANHKLQEINPLLGFLTPPWTTFGNQIQAQVSQPSQEKHCKAPENAASFL